MADVTPYDIDEKKLVWAQKRVKAMRSAMLEIPAALTALKKAKAAMEKAAKACKSQRESGTMTSIVTGIEGLHKILSDFNEDWTNETNAIWLGVMDYQSRRNEENERSGHDD